MTAGSASAAVKNDVSDFMRVSKTGSGFELPGQVDSKKGADVAETKPSLGRIATSVSGWMQNVGTGRLAATGVSDWIQHKARVDWWLRALARIFHALLFHTVTECARLSSIRAKIQNRMAVLF